MKDSDSVTLAIIYAQAVRLYQSAPSEGNTVVAAQGSGAGRVEWAVKKAIEIYEELQRKFAAIDPK